MADFDNALSSKPKMLKHHDPIQNREKPPGGESDIFDKNQFGRCDAMKTSSAPSDIKTQIFHGFPKQHHRNRTPKAREAADYALRRQTTHTGMSDRKSTSFNQGLSNQRRMPEPSRKENMRTKVGLPESAVLEFSNQKEIRQYLYSDSLESGSLSSVHSYRSDTKAHTHTNRHDGEFREHESSRQRSDISSYTQQTRPQSYQQSHTGENYSELGCMNTGSKAPIKYREQRRSICSETSESDSVSSSLSRNSDTDWRGKPNSMDYDNLNVRKDLGKSYRKNTVTPEAAPVNPGAAPQKRTEMENPSFNGSMSFTRQPSQLENVESVNTKHSQAQATQWPRPRSRRRKTVMQREPTKSLEKQEAEPPEETPSSALSTNVYIRVHALIRNIRDLGDILTRKVNTIGVELIPTETCVQHSDTCTFCTLSCENISCARKLRGLFLKNRKFLPRIDCSFQDYCLSPEVKKEQVNKSKEQLRQKVEKELEMMTEQALRAQNEKMSEAQHKIDQIKLGENGIGPISRKAREEISALEHKLDELKNQKQEFTSAIDGLREKLVTLLKKDSGYDSEVQALRKQLGIECCRLQKALPMYAHRSEIVNIIKNNPVSVLLAETGSGKSTQVVQYLVDCGLADSGKIVCTQPRKVAAISLANHVAQELASNIGREVGYKVGMRNKTSNVTKVVYMTDHALLNECLADSDLKAFSCVVIDEAHERSLFTDLLLIMVKRCMKKRPDLRVIITSATIDPQVFVDYFAGDCPVMKVSGRAFPVDVIWDNNADEEKDFENYVEAAVEKAIHIHLHEPPGDILVFLTSAQEIQKCCDLFQERLRGRQGQPNYKVLPLHGQLQADEQQKVFEPLEQNNRKIVFATNCAETSITIDGIKYVIDTGVAKEMRYDAKRNLSSLEVTVISRSSAEQRKGRAGRTAPGKCYRLYSQHSYQAMEAISQPEILKTHLGHALLKLSELGITPDMYDFVQSPSPIAIKDALTTLRRLGALEGDIITDAGRWIARLPLDPKLGSMILKGHECGLLYDVIALAALVNAGSGLFYRGNTDKDRRQMDKVKVKFSHPGGDSMTALSLYHAWMAVNEKQKNKWCMENSVNGKVIRGVRETVNEICQLLKKENIKVEYEFSQDANKENRMRKILFECNTCNLCHYLGKPKAGYFAALASRQVHFHPSSAICSLASFPQWVVYDQLLQTSRDFITGITVVDSDWVNDLTIDCCGFEVEKVKQKQLVNIFTQAAGTHAFYSMVGLRYTRLHELENKAQNLDPSAVIIVEGNKESMEVRVYTTGQADHIKKIKQELQQQAETAQNEIKQDVWEVPVGSEQSGLRVVLGFGGSVTDILMPHETRKVYIRKPTEDITEEEIKVKFQMYGEISYCRQFPQDSREWGFLIFRKAEAAVAAVQGTKDDTNDVARLETRRAVHHNSDFRAKLSWNRRPGKGIAFVTVSPVYMSQLLGFGYLYIGGHLVNMKLDRKTGNDICLQKLPLDVSEDVIRRTILNRLQKPESEEDIVERISVPRVAAAKPTKHDLQHLEKEIKGKILSHLGSSTVQVSVFMPKSERTATFSGEATFSDPIQGFQACKEMIRDGLFLSTGVKVNIEAVVSAVLRVPLPVYDACQEDLKDLISSELEKMDVEVRSEILARGDVKLTIKANETDDLVKARTFLSELFRGDVLECTHAPALQHFLTSAGRKKLKDMEKQANAYISVDNRLRTLAIHGTSGAMTRVRMLINEYMVEMEKAKVEEITLIGGGRPPGLLKALLVRYGEELDVLQREAPLHSIEIDYRRHKLKLKGPQEGVNKAKEMVGKEDATLRAALSLDAAQDEDSVDCSACFCPIDQGDLYRLEACSHPYCKDCILRQMAVAIKDNKVPVICCHEGCDVPLAWRDFNSFIRQGQLQITALASAAVNAYVTANRDKAAFCLTPNCPMVYRVTNEDKADVFSCPECGIHVCTGCCQQAHSGLTCTMLRSQKMDRDSVEAWVREDPHNRKACPGCRSPIQKSGGCNKMHCTACGAIFCWKCTKKFKLEKECYEHLAKEHGGIFELRDILDE